MAKEDLPRNPLGWRAEADKIRRELGKRQQPPISKRIIQGLRIRLNSFRKSPSNSQENSPNIIPITKYQKGRRR